MNENEFGFEWLLSKLNNEIAPELYFQIEEAYREGRYTEEQAESCRNAVNEMLHFRENKPQLLRGKFVILDGVLKEYIPPVLEEPDENCFSKVESEVILPGNITKIGPKAFSGNENIRRIVVSEGTTHIFDFAFRKCKNLEEVILPDSIEFIGVGAFRECRKLKEIKIPPKVTTIQRNMFESCTRLKNVFLPERVTEIGSRAFYSCGLESIVIPEGVTVIPYQCFCSCDRMTSIQLPKGIQRIEPYSFQGCEQLEKINLQEGLEIMDYVCFSGCRNLETLYVPSTVKEIKSPFCDCNKLVVQTPRGSYFVEWYRNFEKKPALGHIGYKGVKEIIEI
ncbi:MAG: leucine-rich repeat domain-containing protein [Eubacteriaceae bacterium]|nr:leucine-rich repeat domain-containing protein [Eubacteriaceae bacterium]